MSTEIFEHFNSKIFKAYLQNSAQNNIVIASYVAELKKLQDVDEH